ncbi:hypothetical protein AT728_34580 [Streptomyces silvensis]|uniref:Uncharacterized protein n=1 Tax=Streptomyces silvensis TaxID=1765722 RepID=A0A0W7WSI3_9ACTN|nr:hypothetical protein AT728_34580 [Streptomyces silvensis]
MSSLSPLGPYGTRWMGERVGVQSHGGRAAAHSPEPVAFAGFVRGLLAPRSSCSELLLFRGLLLSAVSTPQGRGRLGVMGGADSAS